MANDEVKKGKQPDASPNKGSSGRGKRKRGETPEKLIKRSKFSQQGANKNKDKYKKKHPNKTKSGGEKDGIPGAGKLKASIRQTNRLLAKTNLAPGTKIEAERRLAALTADLEKLERSKAEKSTVARYHRIKFFERQKLVRVINKLKKSLDKEAGSDSEDEEEEPQTAEQKKEQLELYRTYLHYVLRFPADQKYVALFPDQSKVPKPPLKTDEDKSRAKASEVLDNIKKAMKKKELSQQPEVDLEKGAAPQNNKAPQATKTTKAKSAAKPEQPKKAAKAAEESDDTQSSDSSSDSDSDSSAANGVKNDDFFAQDSD